MSHNKTIQKLSILFIGVLFIGCSAPAERLAPVGPPMERPNVNSYYKSMPSSEGSLWNDSGKLLYVDNKARRPGDTIMVDIIENSTSKVDANTKTSRTTSLQADVDGMTGNKNLNMNLGTNNLLKAGLTSTMDGKGASDRSGQLTASVGARVTQILPNGNLVIYGRREMKVNEENEILSVSGIVRPDDIGSDNRVKSTYLADARIEYSGDGSLGDRQKPGWGMRILDWVWPF